MKQFVATSPIQRLFSLLQTEQPFCQSLRRSLTSKMKYILDKVKTKKYLVLCSLVMLIKVVLTFTFIPVSLAQTDRRGNQFRYSISERHKRRKPWQIGVGCISRT